jgi:hypothetical protein
MLKIVLMTGDTQIAPDPTWVNSGAVNVCPSLSSFEVRRGISSDTKPQLVKMVFLLVR